MLSWIKYRIYALVAGFSNRRVIMDMETAARVNIVPI